MADSLLTAERARELLRYEPETGRFFWRVDRGTKVKAGSETALKPNSEGYRQIRIGAAVYPAHRIAWLITYGRWPRLQLDHRNGMRGDNRIDNLREVTNGENQQNRVAARCDSATGVMGVGFFKRRGAWRARIQVDGRSKFLGYFDTEQEAKDAYADAKRSLHPFSSQGAPQ